MSAASTASPIPMPISKTLACDPEEELDFVRLLPGYAPEPAAKAVTQPAAVTPE